MRPVRLFPAAYYPALPIGYAPIRYARLGFLPRSVYVNEDDPIATEEVETQPQYPEQQPSRRQSQAPRLQEPEYELDIPEELLSPAHAQTTNGVDLPEIPSSNPEIDEDEDDPYNEEEREYNTAVNKVGTLLRSLYPDVTKGFFGNYVVGFPDGRYLDVLPDPYRNLIKVNFFNPKTANVAQAASHKELQAGTMDMMRSFRTLAKESFKAGYDFGYGTPSDMRRAELYARTLLSIGYQPESTASGVHIWAPATDPDEAQAKYERYLRSLSKMHLPDKYARYSRTRFAPRSAYRDEEEPNAAEVEMQELETPVPPPPRLARRLPQVSHPPAPRKPEPQVVPRESVPEREEVAPQEFIPEREEAVPVHPQADNGVPLPEVPGGEPEPEEDWDGEIDTRQLGDIEDEDNIARFSINDYESQRRYESEVNLESAIYTTPGGREIPLFRWVVMDWNGEETDAGEWNEDSNYVRRQGNRQAQQLHESEPEPEEDDIPHLESLRSYELATFRYGGEDHTVRVERGSFEYFGSEYDAYRWVSSDGEEGNWTMMEDVAREDGEMHANDTDDVNREPDSDDIPDDLTGTPAGTIANYRVGGQDHSIHLETAPYVFGEREYNAYRWVSSSGDVGSWTTNEQNAMQQGQWHAREVEEAEKKAVVYNKVDNVIKSLYPGTDADGGSARVSFPDGRSLSVYTLADYNLMKVNFFNPKSSGIGSTASHKELQSGTLDMLRSFRVLADRALKAGLNFGYGTPSDQRRARIYAKTLMSIGYQPMGIVSSTHAWESATNPEEAQAKYEKYVEALSGMSLKEKYSRYSRTGFAPRFTYIDQEPFADDSNGDLELDFMPDLEPQAPPQRAPQQRTPQISHPPAPRKPQQQVPPDDEITFDFGPEQEESAPVHPQTDSGVSLPETSRTEPENIENTGIIRSYVINNYTTRTRHPIDVHMERALRTFSDGEQTPVYRWRAVDEQGQVVDRGEWTTDEENAVWQGRSHAGNRNDPEPEPEDEHIPPDVQANHSMSIASFKTDGVEHGVVLQTAFFPYFGQNYVAYRWLSGDGNAGQWTVNGTKATREGQEHANAHDDDARAARAAEEAAEEQPEDYDIQEVNNERPAGDVTDYTYNGEARNVSMQAGTFVFNGRPYEAYRWVDSTGATGRWTTDTSTAFNGGVIFAERQQEKAARFLVTNKVDAVVEALYPNATKFLEGNFEVPFPDGRSLSVGTNARLNLMKVDFFNPGDASVGLTASHKELQSGTLDMLRSFRVLADRALKAGLNFGYGTPSDQRRARIYANTLLSIGYQPMGVIAGTHAWEPATDPETAQRKYEQYTTALGNMGLQKKYSRYARAAQDEYGRPLSVPQHSRRFVFYDAKRAPIGGVDVQGKHYPGGQFIPAEVVAQATTEEKAAIEGEESSRHAVKGHSQDEHGRPLVHPSGIKKTIEQIHQALMEAPFEISKGLNGEDAELEKRTQRFAREYYPRLRDMYLYGDSEIGLPANAYVDPQTGDVQSVTLNTDEFRPLFSDYTGTNAAAVHEASSWLNKMVYAEALENQKDKGNGRMMVLAGGGGSGKGTSVGDFFNQSGYPLVLDQVSDNLKKLEAKLDEAKEAGFTPEYVFVDRPPLDAVGGIVGRALNLKKKGKPARTVPIDVGLHANIASRRTAIELMKKRKDIEVAIIDNTGRGKRRLIIDRDEAIAYLEARLEEDEKAVESGLGDRIKKDIAERHVNGEIPTDLAQGFMGSNWEPSTHHSGHSPRGAMLPASRGVRSIAPVLRRPMAYLRSRDHLG